MTSQNGFGNLEEEDLTNAQFPMFNAHPKDAHPKDAGIRAAALFSDQN
jgi:hypothetical protein